MRRNRELATASSRRKRVVKAHVKCQPEPLEVETFEIGGACRGSGGGVKNEEIHEAQFEPEEEVKQSVDHFVIYKIIEAHI
ncbi:hypothetical protein TSUD_35450 [Trifolium subterraneum]|uniref:Uncharacterized protein n=1 Tax=Trifolium subterraneum TaxID=3900 RepID=A0A2Z6MKP7_TRISU|nr:hypothetical protein TSUD_35450 [Trifolium subterraneum]